MSKRTKDGDLKEAKKPRSGRSFWFEHAADLEAAADAAKAPVPLMPAPLPILPVSSPFVTSISQSLMLHVAVLEQERMALLAQVHQLSESRKHDQVYQIKLLEDLEEERGIRRGLEKELTELKKELAEAQKPSISPLQPEAVVAPGKKAPVLNPR